MKKQSSRCMPAEVTKTKTRKHEERRRLICALLVSTMIAVTAIAFAAIKYAPGTYEIDAAHTRVSFTVPHFVISSVEGRFNDVKGSFTLGRPFSASSGKVTVQIASIDTGVKQWDDDLPSGKLFEAEKYPVMTFVARAFRGNPESCRVIGALTIKDVTKEVAFDGKCTGVVTDPWGNQRAAVQLAGVINRKDFHINDGERIEIGPAVGDEIAIRIFAEGIAKKLEK